MVYSFSIHDIYMSVWIETVSGRVFDLLCSYVFHALGIDAPWICCCSSILSEPSFWLKLRLEIVFELEMVVSLLPFFYYVQQYHKLNLHYLCMFKVGYILYSSSTVSGKWYSCANCSPI